MNHAHTLHDVRWLAAMCHIGIYPAALLAYAFSCVSAWHGIPGDESSEQYARLVIVLLLTGSWFGPGLAAHYAPRTGVQPETLVDRALAALVRPTLAGTA